MKDNLQKGKVEKTLPTGNQRGKFDIQKETENQPPDLGVSVNDKLKIDEKIG